MNLRLDRIERSEEVLVDVIDCVDQPDLNATSLACRTVDVSETGIKMTAGMPIPVNTVMGLRLDLSSHLYRLEGEVRWIRDEGKHTMGLLLDEESPDIDEWAEMFHLDVGG